MAQKTLIDMLVPGAVIRLDYGENNLNNKTIHVRAIVDDDQIVYRVWSQRKQLWRYHIEDLYFFTLGYSKDYLKFVRMEKLEA